MPRNQNGTEEGSEEKKKKEVIWDRNDNIIKPIVSKLIEMFPDQLHHVKPSQIGYLSFSKDKSKKLAYVLPVKKMYRTFFQLDYLLCVHVESWESMTASEQYVLILHELAHIPEGGFDPEMKSYRKTVDHNVKDFDFIIKAFGVDWEDSAKILNDKKMKKVEAKSAEAVAVENIEEKKEEKAVKAKKSEKTEEAPETEEINLEEKE